jgi:hypothetical protein
MGIGNQIADWNRETFLYSAKARTGTDARTRRAVTGLTVGSAAIN